MTTQKMTLTLLSLCRTSVTFPKPPFQDRHAENLKQQTLRPKT